MTIKELKERLEGATERCGEDTDVYIFTPDVGYKALKTGIHVTRTGEYRYVIMN